MLFKKEKKTQNIVDKDVSTFHTFIRDKVDVLNEAVAKFIYDSADHIESVNNKKLAENFLTLIESIQEYESSRKEIDTMMDCYDIKLITATIAGTIPSY